jgi:ferredoxin
MKKVIVQPGCITCGTCEFEAPEVFTVTDISHVNMNADLKKNCAAIKKAAQLCPVNVIEFEE